jgi:tetratricopeptide (TPR) repeat protein
VPVGDVFHVQDELARRIIDSLRSLTARERRMLRNDVPSSNKAYEFFLRGNQLSVDAKQWHIARDLYERCVQADPRYAPAWARLGRIRHVMAKYLESGTHQELERAEEAFRRALELNPDLPIAHKSYAQFEVDQGRAHHAMVRLLGRARSADPELFAGLVSTCRYCGLLEASVAADARARRLEPRIRSSAAHTWFLQGDYQRVAGSKIHEYPYIVALSLGALGRQQEAIAALRELEKTTWTRFRDFMVARTLLEGDAAQSPSPSDRGPTSVIQRACSISQGTSPTWSRQAALGLLERVIAGGFFLLPGDGARSWLDLLRKKPDHETTARGGGATSGGSGRIRTCGWPSSLVMSDRGFVALRFLPYLTVLNAEVANWQTHQRGLAVAIPSGSNRFRTN